MELKPWHVFDLINTVIAYLNFLRECLEFGFFYVVFNIVEVDVKHYRTP